MPTIRKLYRYPIKGMSAEALRIVSLEAARPIYLDRCIALAHGTTTFDPDNPQHLSKTHYLMLMKNERLAQLKTEFDDATSTLRICQQGKLVISGDLENPDDKAALEAFFADFLGEESQGKPTLVFASEPHHTFSDVDAKVISCINLASLEALEKLIGQPIHPLRFRANLYFDQAAPWEEENWVGKTWQLGTAKVRGVKMIKRCAAIQVNPETAERDLSLLQTLQQQFGHVEMGIYVEVVQAGDIQIDDSFTVE